MLLVKTHVIERKKTNVNIVLKFGKFKRNIWLWKIEIKQEIQQKTYFC